MKLNFSKNHRFPGVFSCTYLPRKPGNDWYAGSSLIRRKRHTSPISRRSFEWTEIEPAYWRRGGSREVDLVMAQRLHGRGCWHHRRQGPQARAESDRLFRKKWREAQRALLRWMVSWWIFLFWQDSRGPQGCLPHYYQCYSTRIVVFGEKSI